GVMAVLYVSRDSAVTITVDGQARHLHTFATTVGGALADAGLHPGPHDRVLPPVATRLHQGEQIAFDRGRLLHLTVDGKPVPDWVTTTTVSAALAQLGLSTAGEFVSVPVTSPIGLSGMALQVRLPQRIEVLADGRAHRVVTTAPRVSDVLAALHISVRHQDRVTVPVGRYPLTGMVIRVIRVDGAVVDDNVAIPFTVIRRLDSSLVQGDDPVVVPGVDGVLVRVYALTYLDHRLAASRLVRSYVAQQPTTEIIEEGTAAPPPPPAYGSYGGLGNLNWAALANCESGGNPQAVSPDGQYYGLYQFALSTWYSVGGTGNPIYASSSEQTYRAEILYARDGAGAWPVCGAYL
ncbi:MAG: ubiquitin-like domain-containing protein, partial [Mycobacteriales bacterium]